MYAYWRCNGRGYRVEPAEMSPGGNGYVLRVRDEKSGDTFRCYSSEEARAWVAQHATLHGPVNPWQPRR